MSDTESDSRSLFPLILDTLILSVYFEQTNDLDEIAEFCVTVIARIERQEVLYDMSFLPVSPSGTRRKPLFYMREEWRSLLYEWLRFGPGSVCADRFGAR
jgi:hypothetical protein